MVTHDWPVGITDYGDVHGLLRLRPDFKGDIQMNKLGNPAAMDLLNVRVLPLKNFINVKFGFPAHFYPKRGRF